MVWKLGLQLLEFCFVKKHLRNIQGSNDQNIKRYWAYLVSYIKKCVYYMYNVVYSMFVSFLQAFQPSSYYTIFEISQIVKAEVK